MLGISVRQLEVFVSIASTGTVREAAHRLCVTQPAVSMALGELERHLGTPLFDRERGRLHLSPRGKELLPIAQEVLERMQEMVRQGLEAPLTLTGTLRIGASNTIGNYLVGDLLGSFLKHHSQVALHVEVNNTHSIAAGLLNHNLDIGAIEGPMNHPQLELIPWREDTLVVCAKPDHPLAQITRLKSTDFAGCQWILREPGSAMRTQAEQALSSLPEGRIVLELGQVEAIKQAVIAGLGLACLPESAVIDPVANNRLCILSTPFLNLRRRLSLVLHKSRYRGALIDAFLNTVLPGNAKDSNHDC